MKLAAVDKAFEVVIQLVLMEQFMSTCNIELATLPKERACKDTKGLDEHANKYLKEHGKQFKDVCKSPKKKTTSSEGKIYCTTCKKSGHEGKIVIGRCYMKTQVSLLTKLPGVSFATACLGAYHCNLCQAEGGR